MIKMCPECGRMDDDYTISMYGVCSYCRAMGRRLPIRRWRG